MTPVRFLRTLAILTADNLRTHFRRAAYLAATLCITTAAWLTLSALAAPFVATSATGSGVTIANGSQQSAPLPLRYAPRLQAISGARQVAWFTLQIVGCGANVQVTLNAWGGPGAIAQVTSPHKRAMSASVQTWSADPLGVLASKQAATDCGWRIGQGISPPVAFGTKQIPMHISGIFDGRGDVAYAHYDYINRIGALFGKDTVLKFVASAGNARDDELLAARIESAFAHDFPTIMATTNTTAQNAWARFGKVQQLLAFVMVAILLCAALVLVSVLAHAAAQRRSKFALLKVLGFQSSTLFCAFALEAIASVAAGVLCGIGICALAAHVMPFSVRVTLGGMAVPGWAYMWLPIWAALLAAAALAWPAATISRVHPIDRRTV